MDETINKNFNVDPDSFEVPRQSSEDKTNRLVYRTNEIKPATNLEEIQKQNTITQNQIKEKENEGIKSRQSTNKNITTPKSKEEKKEKDKKPYYGRTLVFVIIILIIIEYYVYVFERLDNNNKGKTLK
jgi:hypothetical protein